MFNMVWIFKLGSFLYIIFAYEYIEKLLITQHLEAGNSVIEDGKIWLKWQLWLFYLQNDV